MEDVNLVLVTTLLRIFHKKLRIFHTINYGFFSCTMNIFLKCLKLMTVSQKDVFPEGKNQLWEPAFWESVFWETTLLGKRHSGKLSFWETDLLGKILLGKLPSGKLPLGNFLTPKNMYSFRLPQFLSITK